MAQNDSCRPPLLSRLLLLLRLALPWQPRLSAPIGRCRDGTDARRWSEGDDDRVAHVVSSVDAPAGQVTPWTASNERRERTASFRPAESICNGQYTTLIFERKFYNNRMKTLAKMVFLEFSYDQCTWDAYHETHTHVCSFQSGGRGFDNSTQPLLLRNR